MNVVDYLVIALVLVIVGAAAFYVIRAKRKGQKCIGCPYAKNCGGRCKE